MVETFPNLEGLKVIKVNHESTWLMSLKFTQEKSVQISACGVGHGLCFEALVRCLGKPKERMQQTNDKRKTSDDAEVI